MTEKLDLDALEALARAVTPDFVKACEGATDIKSTFPNLAFVAKATPAVILGLISRIRELERASQPGSGELDLPGLRVAIRAFTPHMHDWISKVIDALERQPGGGEAEDAARYRFIRDVPYTPEVHHTMSLQLNATMDKVIDAARASLDGRS